MTNLHMGVHELGLGSVNLGLLTKRFLRLKCYGCVGGCEDCNAAPKCCNIDFREASLGRAFHNQGASPENVKSLVNSHHKSFGRETPKE